MLWRRRWCLLEENKNFAENKNKNGEESGWKEEILMIIHKRPIHWDDHLQKARPSQWSFAKGPPIRIIICKRPADPDDHLQTTTTTGRKGGWQGWRMAGSIFYIYQHPKNLEFAKNKNFQKWGSTVWYFVVVGLYRVVLFCTWWYWVSIGYYFYFTHLFRYKIFPQTGFLWHCCQRDGLSVSLFAS